MENMTKSWPPDVTSGMLRPEQEGACIEEDGGWTKGFLYREAGTGAWGPCMVRSNASWVMVT